MHRRCTKENTQGEFRQKSDMEVLRIWSLTSIDRRLSISRCQDISTSWTQARISPQRVNFLLGSRMLVKAIFRKMMHVAILLMKKVGLARDDGKIVKRNSSSCTRTSSACTDGIAYPGFCTIVKSSARGVSGHKRGIAAW